MNNAMFVKQVFSSIKKGIPPYNQKDVKDIFQNLLDKHSSKSNLDFQAAFMDEAKPLIETYSRELINKELATIRKVLVGFAISSVICFIYFLLFS